jgi:uncharacterized membrane protein (DUF373 family)
MLFNDNRYLGLIDGSERLLAKVLGVVLLLVMVVATGQLVSQVLWALFNPQTTWISDKLIKVLGDLLNLLIAVEVLQNITSYLRRHVVQIELVLITAMTAVARKVIVLPPGSENKPQLLAGLGVAVLALAGAYWLVRNVNRPRLRPKTGPARPFQEQDP